MHQIHTNEHISGCDNCRISFEFYTETEYLNQQKNHIHYNTSTQYMFCTNSSLAQAKNLYYVFSHFLFKYSHRFNICDFAKKLHKKECMLHIFLFYFYFLLLYPSNCTQRTHVHVHIRTLIINKCFRRAERKKSMFCIHVHCNIVIELFYKYVYAFIWNS